MKTLKKNNWTVLSLGLVLAMTLWAGLAEAKVPAKYWIGQEPEHMPHCMHIDILSPPCTLSRTQRAKPRS